MRCESHRIRAGFTGTDTDHFVNGAHENFTVADFAGMCGFDDGVYGRVHQTVVDHQFHFDFGQKIHHIFGTAIQLGVTFLTAKAFYFGHS